jgi:hypothetical protein
MKGRHTSLDKHLKNHILWIEEIPAVQKVVLGISEACRHKYPPGHVRFKMDVNGGIKLNSYSGIGITDIFIKIDPITERENVKKLIAERFKLHTPS